MRKSLQLSIPSPCEEKWGNMHPAKSGRFCDSCQKQVIDFSRMSDQELLSFFKQPSTGSVCGRFSQRQLDAPIVPATRRIPWMNYFFRFTIPLFLTSLKAQSQVGKVALATSCSPVPADTSALVFVGKILAEHGQTTIQGIVTDENGRPFPFASVRLGGKATATDEKGSYQLSIQQTNDPLTLRVSAVGYMTQERQVDVSSGDDQTIDVSLTEMVTMGEVVVAGMVITQHSKEKDSLYSRPTIPDLSTIYPNPLVNGQPLQVRVKQDIGQLRQLSVLNMAGAIVYQQKISIEAANSTLALALPNLSSGNYFVRFECIDPRKSYSSKLIIQ